MASKITAPQRMELSRDGFELTKSGLAVTGEPTAKECDACWDALGDLENATPWSRGDCLIVAKRHYGDDVYEQYAARSGLKKHTLEQYKWVASLFEISNRLENLSFRHHMEVSTVKATVRTTEGNLAVGDEPDREAITELLEKAERGDDNKRWPVEKLREAVRKHKEAQRERIRLANEPEKYAVIYIDPPWQYNDSRGDDPDFGAATGHYECMPLENICKLPLSDMAASDCIAFVWATSPMLTEALEAVKAWGFDYKSQMVWDKVRHNLGHYVSVRHEILLICIRGNPPKATTLEDSVYVEERTEHSRKPVYFRELIDRLYPSGKRIELFCRGDAPDNWDTWGNEAE